MGQSLIILPSLSRGRLEKRWERLGRMNKLSVSNLVFSKKRERGRGVSPRGGLAMLNIGYVREEGEGAEEQGRKKPVLCLK